jgi:hypothetical protein
VEYYNLTGGQENMFLNEPGDPSNSKELAYMLASVILGILLSFIACELLEVSYFNNMPIRGDGAFFNAGYAMLRFFQGIILLIGAIGGFFVGRFWWRKIYIERVWIKK